MLKKKKEMQKMIRFKKVQFLFFNNVTKTYKNYQTEINLIITKILR